jgi:hypothetical protein
MLAGVVVGLELLNEPLVDLNLLKSFYQRATDNIIASGFKGQIW